MEEQAIIYGVKSNKGYKYIGKTIKSIRGNRELRKTDVGAQYVNPKLKDALHENPDVNMVVLKTIAVQEWYDEKLKEVVDKHKDQHPLINAQWMLDGKRGYWEGKERDKHTLQRLSESKYKRVVQYDKQGKLVKIWESGKEVATKVFKDYRVTNGCGCTKLYHVLSASTLKGRLRFDSYWFREEYLMQNFKSVPNKLDLNTLRKTEAQYKKDSYKRPETYRRYTVIHCDVDGQEIQRYPNIFEAGLAFKLSPSIIARICRGMIVPKDYVLKYGKKELQPMDVKKYNYKTIPINANRGMKKQRINPDDIYDVDL